MHELSHALVARKLGLPVVGITLFALGGVSETAKEASNPRTEFLVGIVGPITSFLIALICCGLAWLAGWPILSIPQSPLTSVLVWLGYINVVIAVFNLIPGFPLDGGRVLRAAVWRATGDANRSKRIAARIGQIFAVILLTIGFLRFFSGGGLDGLWLVLVGWFLLEAARASYSQVKISELLRTVRVGDAMSRECPALDGRLNLQTFVEDVMMRTGRRCFIVTEKGALSGLVTLHEIKEVDRVRWPFTTIDEIKKPLRRSRQSAQKRQSRTLSRLWEEKMSISYWLRAMVISKESFREVTLLSCFRFARICN